jgi:uncharacterized protein YhaN
MRIQRIDLAAYGRFTEASIDFGARDNRVHLVYGPNEAGKSTLLRAIWAFFYGDLKKTPDDYQHPVANLKIGMTLETPSGEIIRWTRRGGGNQSLRDEADRPVTASMMQKLLSEISESAFQQQFAINHDQLRRGSQELYEDKGELGAALFSAATGLTSVGRVASELEKEANDIFKPRATTLPINKAIKQIKDLKDSLRKSSVSTSKYNEILRLRNEAAECAQKLHAERTTCQDRVARLQRIVVGIPKIVRLGELTADLMRLPPAPALSENFGSRRQTASASREITTALIKENELRLNTLNATLAQIRPDQTAMELLPKLSSLEKKYGSYEKAQLDRAKLDGEIAKSTREVEELRRSLQGVHAKAQAPPRHDLQHFRRRLSDYQAQSANLRSLQRDVASIESQLARYESDTAQVRGDQDIQPLKTAIAEALLRTSIDLDIDKLTLQITQLTQTTNADLQSLAINRPAAEFVSVELPLAAKLADYDRRHGRIEKQLEEAQRREKELTASREDLAHRLAALLGGGQVPTEADVARARSKRDLLWREIRAFLAVPNAPAEKAPLLKKLDDDLAVQFESAVQEADRLSDLLRSEAQRIAERLSLEAEIAVAGGKLTSAQSELSKVEEDRRAFLAEWSQFAATAPTSPRMPAELKEWQPSALRLQDQLRKLGNLQAESNQLREKSASLIDSIASAGALLKLSLPGKTLGAILPFAQEKLRELEAEQNRRLAAADQISELKSRLAASRQDLATSQIEADVLWKELTASTQRWQWGEIENSAELERFVPLMEDLERLDGEIREKANRIKGIDRDAMELAGQLAEIAAKLGASRSNGSLDECMAAISSRLQETQRQRDQALDLQAQATELEKLLVQQRQKLLLAESELKALVIEAGADSIEALPQIELQAQRRAAIEGEKRSIETQLDALYEDQTRDEFAAQCRQTDLETVRREIADLQSRTAELESQLELGREELRTHEAWLRDNQTLEKVAKEEQSLHETLSELHTLVRAHVKTRLAAEVLHRAMQRYRDDNQGDLLRTGGEVFSRLTASAYSGIRTEISNGGVAELLAARGDQPPVPLLSLSDGARDQLYLSLRIATLKQHFSHHPPMPFIVDDIFVMFDEGRTLAALQELARLAESTQVIVLTHHAHVLELALSGLGERCVTHELTQSGPFRTSAMIHEAHQATPIPMNANLSAAPGRKRPKEKSGS